MSSVIRTDWLDRAEELAQRQFVFVVTGLWWYVTISVRVHCPHIRHDVVLLSIGNPNPLRRTPKPLVALTSCILRCAYPVCISGVNFRNARPFQCTERKPDSEC